MDRQAEVAYERPPSTLQRLALVFTRWAEKWFPDAYVFALGALALAIVATLAIGAKPTDVVAAFGDNYWNLLRFTYQMAMVLIAGYAIAMSAPVKRALQRLAAVPSTGPQAIVWIIFLSTLANLLNWGFGMIFSALLVMFMAQRPQLRLDYRTAAAAGLAGSCTVSMLGLSSGPALLQASAASMPAALAKAGGVIPTSETLFTWQNAVMIVVVTLVALAVGWATAPRGRSVRTAQDLGVAPADTAFDASTATAAQERRPGDWLATTPYLAIAFGLLSALWIGRSMMQVGFAKTVSDLNNYIFICLTVAMLLHGRIKNFLDAVYAAVPAVGPILIQFPIYAATAAIITTVHNPAGASISSYLGDFFIDIGGHYGLPLVVGVYSIVMGFFIPAAGARWVLEAPYVFHAGQATEQHLGWLLMTFNGSETLTSFLNPFWMLPILGVLKLKPRNIVGITFLYFALIAPVALLMLWGLSFTFAYHPPVGP